MHSAHRCILSKSSKKSFAIIAIIVGAVGIGLGIYTIATVGSMLDESTAPDSGSESGTSTGQNQSVSSSSSSAAGGEGLHPLALNGSPLLGSPDAPVTIVEYGDYQCPGCQRFATQVKPLIIENYIDAGKVKLVFKDFAFYGDDSIKGAISASCAADQDRFWEMHDLFYSNQMEINSGWLNSDAIKGFASELGLDMQEFSACLDGKRYAHRVIENFNEARSIGIDGTPAFIIIDSKGETVAIKGAQPFSTFKRVLDGML